MFQKILVPVDGSNTAWKALKTAAVLAGQFKGELVVMTVMEPYDAIGALSMDLDPEIMASNLGAMKKPAWVCWMLPRTKRKKQVSPARWTMWRWMAIRLN